MKEEFICVVRVMEWQERKNPNFNAVNYETNIPGNKFGTIQASYPAALSEGEEIAKAFITLGAKRVEVEINKRYVVTA